MPTLPTVTHPAYGDGASTYASRQETWMANAETNEQAVEDRIEATNNTMFGTGVVAGSYTAPLLAIGTGLQVTIADHTALIGIVVEHSGAGSVAVPDDTAAVYLWERQDGTYTATATSTNPGTAANPAVQIGKCVTAAGAVSSVDNTARTEVVKPGMGRIEEWFGPSEAGTHAKTWDANGDDRTGGSLTMTLDHTPATGTLVEVFRAGSKLRQTAQWTIAGAVVTFTAGNHPVLDGVGGEDVSVVYTPA